MPDREPRTLNRDRDNRVPKPETAEDLEIKKKLLRREGKTEEQFQAELKATRVVKDAPGWPPQPTDGERD